MTDREANAELTWPENCSAVHPQLDSTASCSVCNDFYDTPLVLPCGHSFCSSCIRSYISHQQGQARCPQCRAVCDERDLIPNTALRDLVDKLLQARPAYIAAVRGHKPGHSRLVKAAEGKQGAGSTESSPHHGGSNKRQLRSGRTLGNTAPEAAAAAVAAVDAPEVQQSPRKRQRTAGNDSMSTGSGGPPASAKITPATADVAACPICSRTFKAGRVLEAHVNRCIDNPPAVSQEVPAAQQQQQPHRPPKKPQRGIPQVKVPAKIAFHLFNDRKLRDKLKDYNLPITGKRKELEDRYNRLRLEVQLAADKGEAASEADLIRRAMAKEKSAPPVKGFFAKGALKTSGSGADASDDPDVPEVEYDSFAALIQATKERDAARKAKQQKAQLEDAQAPASTPNHDTNLTTSGTAAEPMHQCPEECEQEKVGLSHTKDAAANGLPAERQVSDGQTPIGQEEQLADYPAGVQSSGDEQPPDAVLPTRGMAAKKSTAELRFASQDLAQRPALHSGGHVSQVQSSKAQEHVRQCNLQTHTGKSQHPSSGYCGSHDRVELTCDELSEGLSQDSLGIDLDEAGPTADPAAQDQRALQQLQLLNKSAVPSATVEASLAKAAVSLPAKAGASPTFRAYPVSLDQTRNEDALGVLDDIIEDTESDIEGLAS